MRVHLILILLISFCLSSCLHDKADDFAPRCDSSFFADSIKPIYLTNCYDPDHNGGCHNEAAATERGNFSTYDAAKNGIQSRVEAMKYRLNLPLADPDHMPKGRELTTSDLDKLNNWLNANAPYCR
jgi:hypothetical protein